MPKKSQPITPSNGEKKINSVPYFFIWKTLQPDARQYKPSNPLLEIEKPIRIRIDVPLQPDLIYNASEFSIAEISATDIPEPILTPLGMRYIVDQFEAVMSNPKVDNSEDKSEDSSEDDWDDEGTEEKSTERVDSKSSESKSSDEEWDEESKETDEKADFDSDDEWND